MPRSPSSSPVRKRARLSSPTYDDQVGELTQEDLDAFDAIDAQLSQNVRPPAHASTFQRASVLEKDNGGWDSSQPEPTPMSGHAGFSFAKASGLEDDPDNPFSGGFASAAKVAVPAGKPIGFTTASFASASKLPLVHDHERSPSPDAPPPEPDFDAWFQPAAVDATPVFQVPIVAAFSTGSALVGFTKASNKGVIKPSAKALALAKAKEDAWNREEEERIRAEAENSRGLGPPTDTGFKLASSTSLLAAESPRNVLGSAPSHILNTPSTPSPAAFSRPSFTRPIAESGSQGSPAKSNSIYRPKQFKPPMLRQPNTLSAMSPLNPRRGNPHTTSGFAPASSQPPSTPHPHPLAGPPITSQSNFVTPARTSGFNAPTSTSFTTPLRATNNTRVPPSTLHNMRRTTPAPFKTPFKPGMGPSEAGRIALNEAATKQSAPASVASRKLPAATPARPAENLFTTERIPRAKPVKKTFFNTSRDSPRQTLAESGLRPQQYKAHELEDMGIPIAMLSQITPETAMYYAFNANPSSSMASSSTPQPTSRGPVEALEALLARGCTLATRPWVDNHWALILWKLAGMVVLEASNNKDNGAKTSQERWCWDEVLRQLLYRYERELHGGARPPLRRIVNQDTPAACPLVLCVSGVFWSPPGVTEDGMPVEPHPELEVTDGWYRLRARVDLPLARAVRRGVVRVGRKLGVAGARLETEKKDPMEILEAYSSNKLAFTGNSSHLMPWHAKLGWMQGPCISTLHSLSSDGGLVTAMDLVYPVAYIEFIEEEDGTKGRIGPRNEAEQMQVNEKWKRRYQLEASKLRETHEKKIARYEGYLDRLERKSAGQFRPQEDEYPPDRIDALYDELEYPDSAARCLAKIGARDAGWLALHIRKESERARERVSEDVEKEMMSICPPRNVRSFRVLIVEDARTSRRPKNRVAQLTMWDAAGLSLDDDNGGGGGGAAFAAGQRFTVTNLIPQQLSAWMDCAPGSEVYLSTRKDSRWTRIRGGV
ncbi:hypothetical protein D9619_002620 [Psilocybe cf. subviscida]|uniref:BRCA2 OB1 domain-containing protein n=1 Tax=Psilocybe cf. subviscida TaxID=2480587 RepID=A0A8H5EUT3_9AGAR|nr:hypothetical protein D9619_002620 [Psilocybe cf. subviscida]